MSADEAKAAKRQGKLPARLAQANGNGVRPLPQTPAPSATQDLAKAVVSETVTGANNVSGLAKRFSANGPPSTDKPPPPKPPAKLRSRLVGGTANNARPAGVDSNGTPPPPPATLTPSIPETTDAIGNAAAVQAATDRPKASGTLALASRFEPKSASEAEPAKPVPPRNKLANDLRDTVAATLEKKSDAAQTQRQAATPGRLEVPLNVQQALSSGPRPAGSSGNSKPAPVDSDTSSEEEDDDGEGGGLMSALVSGAEAVGTVAGAVFSTVTNAVGIGTAPPPPPPFDADGFAAFGKKLDTAGKDDNNGQQGAPVSTTSQNRPAVPASANLVAELTGKLGQLQPPTSAADAPTGPAAAASAATPPAPAAIGARAMLRPTPKRAQRPAQSVELTEAQRKRAGLKPVTTKSSLAVLELVNLIGMSQVFDEAHT